jgi:predicted GNAT superfamily acetyltransferase
LRRGVERIRWTAEPLSATALALYLSGLGARLRAYEPELYAAVRPAAVPPDDVVIDWELSGRPRREVVADVHRVEIPFDHRRLAAAELAGWRRSVRAAMCRALDRGLFGTGVAFDRGARRSWVLFQAGEGA